MLKGFSLASYMFHGKSHNPLAVNNIIFVYTYLHIVSYHRTPSQEKVQSLEQSLTVVIREFEHEKQLLEERQAQQLASSSSELVTLKRRCELQEREMNHVKRLARKILQERSEVEQFFLEALAHVKKEIAANRCGEYNSNNIFMSATPTPDLF